MPSQSTEPPDKNTGVQSSQSDVEEGAPESSPKPESRPPHERGAPSPPTTVPDKMYRLAFWQAMFSACLVGTAILALYVSQKQWQTAQAAIDLAQQQLWVNQDPVISLPTEVKGEDGVFTLQLRNTGPAVEGIEAYEDCFVAHKLKGRLQLYQFKPRVVVSERHVIEHLGQNKAADFDVTCKEHRQEMQRIYSADPLGGLMSALRVRLRYRRAADGKVFSMTKTYILAGAHAYLFAPTVDDSKAFASGDLITLDEVKAVLGSE